MRRSVICLDLSLALKQLDTDGDGSISSAELDSGLRRMGLVLSGPALSRLIARFDRDGDGAIDYKELIRFIQQKKSTGAGPSFFLF